MKKVMENEEHKIDEHLVTKQKLLKLPLVRWRSVQKWMEKSHDAQRMMSGYVRKRLQDARR